jgi:hypothetical protein
MSSPALFHWHEPAFRTQYAELKERARAAGQLLPGTAGTLARRSPNSNRQEYWYRVYYSVPGRRAEQFVGPTDDTRAYEAMCERMASAEWMQAQVIALRKLGYQVADKKVARVLVELHNRGAFAAEVVLVGAVGYMAWLNELGARTAASHTQDIDLARPERFQLALPVPFLETLADTGLPFVEVPAMSSSTPSTSVKLPGVDQLRIDLLAPGKTLGAAIRIPGMKWHAKAVPYFDYLLEESELGAVLAGVQCIPVRLPRPARMVWHKLYSSAQRVGEREKAARDRQQALTLAAVLAEGQPAMLEAGARAMSKKMRSRVAALKTIILRQLTAHKQAADILAACLR